VFAIGGGESVVAALFLSGKGKKRGVEFTLEERKKEWIRTIDGGKGDKRKKKKGGVEQIDYSIKRKKTILTYLLERGGGIRPASKEKEKKLGIAHRRLRRRGGKKKKKGHDSARRWKKRGLWRRGKRRRRGE